MGPVTGSDALHYHFTTPQLVLSSGFHPDFFLSHSFFKGQTHLLILAGLALGSSQLAMGLLFFGGVLVAAAGACLARRWTDRCWAWVAALAFLLTPVVFWQISTAGAPDLWMAFFATVRVLVISRAREKPRRTQAILAGAFAGAVAWDEIHGMHHRGEHGGRLLLGSAFDAQVSPAPYRVRLAGVYLSAGGWRESCAGGFSSFSAPPLTASTTSTRRFLFSRTACFFTALRRFLTFRELPLPCSPRS